MVVEGERASIDVQKVDTGSKRERLDGATDLL
jgi:hypothetical protein